MRHIPVLQDTVCSFLPSHTSIVVDWTVGHCGHANAITDFASAQWLPLQKIYWFDIDIDVISYVSDNQIADYRIDLHNIPYSSLHNFMHENQLSAEFVLLDLWLNWQHVLSRDRGFSFKKTWKLDMRFDQNSWATTFALLQKTDINQLTDVFLQFGDFWVKKASLLAKTLIKNRRNPLLQTTTWMVQLLYNSWIHKNDIARVFQSLRIMTNNEFDHIQQFFAHIHERLSLGWRCAIISYHSGEDRVVKLCMQKLQNQGWKLLTSPIIVPSYKEIKYNKAARSAKLRVIEKIV